MLETVCWGSDRAEQQPPSHAPWRGLPWLTLVLGSGCLDNPDSPASDPRRFESVVKELVAEIRRTEAAERSEEPFFDELSLDESRAGDFAAALVCDRLGTTQSSSADGAELTVPPIAARVTLIAWLLTRFFHLARSEMDAPVSRWVQDTADVFSDQETRITEVVQLAQWHLGKLRAELDVPPAGLDRKVARAVEGFFDEIDKTLYQGGFRTKHRLGLSQLRIATELAWYFLTLETPVYPGWTDLLLKLALQEDQSVADRIRPRFLNLRKQADLLRSLLQNSATTSWRESGSTSPYPMHGAAATVLWAQAAAVRSARRILPPACAFVTSFDMELEMALWRAAPEGASFFVLIPVLVFRQASDHAAEACWLRAEISKSRGNDGLEAILKPQRWDVVGAHTDINDLRAGPHVIRLSGSPLVTLPSDEASRTHLAARLEELAIRDLEPATMLISHAVTVDEYLAVRQWESDLLHRVAQGTGGIRDRALPRPLREDTPAPGKNRRFWLALGVPVGDAAVRHRLVSQIAGPIVPGEATASSGLSGVFAPEVIEGAVLEPTAEEAHEDAEDPWRRRRPAGFLSGVVVNRRITEDDAQPLYWVGFDVVRDDARPFIEDLLHYADHLHAGGAPQWPFNTTEDCPLEQTGPQGAA